MLDINSKFTDSERATCGTFCHMNERNRKILHLYCAKLPVLDLIGGRGAEFNS